VPEPDLSAILQQAQAMQQQLLAAQAQAQAAQVEGRAGGTSVVVTMTGGGEVTKVRIDPSVVDSADVEMLEDLVLAALHDAAAQVARLQSEAMGDLGGALGGLGLPGLGG
jgi:DNA-binding YbaB/EbfC family protein